MDGEPPPPVALVAWGARADRGPQLARELLREAASRVQSLPRPGMQVCTLIRSSSAARKAIDSTAERRSRSSRPPSSATNRIVSSASTGTSCHPSLDPSAGTTNTPTGRSTAPTLPSCSPASESQVSEPIR